MMTEMKNFETELTEDALEDVAGGVYWLVAIPLGIYIGVQVGKAINKARGK